MSSEERYQTAGRFLFYRFDTTPKFEPSGWRFDANFTMQLWRPSVRTPWPRGVEADKKAHFVFRTLLHLSGIFPSRDSGAVLMYSDTRLVHYSAFTPRYFRFPFLTARDVQVGDTWTEPLYRGRGLAKRSLRQLLILLSEPGRSIWYVVEDANPASIKVVEDCGFHLAAVGTRVKRLKGFDHYEITESRAGPYMRKAVN
jgi:RimJ/RimL family protein N-acetyltransferase